MIKSNEKHAGFALVQEILETLGIIREFRLANVEQAVAAVKGCGKLFFSGEGSSRIFPAGNAICYALKEGLGLTMAAEGGRQAMEYNLDDFVVFGASNSGVTSEVVTLFEKLGNKGHKHLYGLTARENMAISKVARQTFLLSCGWERAIAATKSVAEQAAFYLELLAQIQGNSLRPAFAAVADKMETALATSLDSDMIETIASAGMIYIAGRNDGLAEELALKASEITRKKCCYLEGTSMLHGVAEVMKADDVVIVIDPFEAESKMVAKTLINDIGVKIYAISDRETLFPTVQVENAGLLQNFVYLAAGWNILVEVGLHLDIDLDKAHRVKKVGNAYVGSL